MFIAPGHKNIIQQGRATMQALIGKIAIAIKDNVNLSSVVIYNMASSLHEWNYQNATDIGDFITNEDTGTIGGFDMSNPLLANKPTLAATRIEYDSAGSEFIKYDTDDFRIGDTTGCMHFYVDNIVGQTSRFFVASDSADGTNFQQVIFNTFEQPIFQLRKSGTVYQLVTTNASLSGMLNVSLYCTGSDVFFIINGLKITSYSTDSIIGKWWAFLSAGFADSISIASVLRPTPVYSPVNQAYANYTPFVNESTCMSEHFDMINNNTIVGKHVTEFNSINAWSSSLCAKEGTTTQFTDYKQEHNLINPGSTNQPTFTESNAAFNGMPSFNFVTDDYVSKATNFRNGDNTGVITYVFKSNGNNTMALTKARSINGYDRTYNDISSNKVVFSIRVGTVITTIESDLTISAVAANVVSIAQDGAEMMIFVNGVKATVVATAGTNGTQWIGQLTNSDRLAIGACLRSAPIYGAMDWAFSDYMAYTDDATIIAKQEALATIYIP